MTDPYALDRPRLQPRPAFPDDLALTRFLMTRLSCTAGETCRTEPLEAGESCWIQAVIYGRGQIACEQVRTCEREPPSGAVQRVQKMG
jgi:hypothetical protein